MGTVCCDWDGLYIVGTYVTCCSCGIDCVGCVDCEVSHFFA